MADISDLIGPGAIPPKNKPEDTKADKPMQAEVKEDPEAKQEESTPADQNFQPMEVPVGGDNTQQVKAAGASAATAAIANQAIASGIAGAMALQEESNAQMQSQGAAAVANAEAGAAVEEAAEEEQANQQQQEEQNRQEYQKKMLEAAKKREEQMQKNKRLKAKKKKKKGGFLKKSLKKNVRNAATRNILYAGGGPMVGGSYQIIDWLT